MNLRNERVVVTGGAGFLGKYLHAELLHRGVDKENLLVPLIEDYDLTSESGVARMYEDMAPTVVIHLAAEVAGIKRLTPRTGRGKYKSGAAILLRHPPHFYSAVYTSAGSRSSSRSERSVRTPISRRFHSKRRTCGMATRRRPTPRTGSRRRRCW